MFSRRLDAKDPLVPKSIEAGPFASFVLGFIDLGRFGTGEHFVRGLPSTSRVMPAYFAGVTSQAISLTRSSVSPRVRL